LKTEEGLAAINQVLCYFDHDKYQFNYPEFHLYFIDLLLCTTAAIWQQNARFQRCTNS